MARLAPSFPALSYFSYSPKDIDSGYVWSNNITINSCIPFNMVKVFKRKRGNQDRIYGRSWGEYLKYLQSGRLGSLKPEPDS